MMFNDFGGMVDPWNVLSFISSWGHCQRSPLSQISNMPQTGFEHVQNLSFGLCWMKLHGHDNHYSMMSHVTTLKECHFSTNYSQNISLFFEWLQIYLDMEKNKWPFDHHHQLWHFLMSKIPNSILEGNLDFHQHSYIFNKDYFFSISQTGVRDEHVQHVFTL